jgi:DNA-binding XRE family transcriptional regulator
MIVSAKEAVDKLIELGYTQSEIARRIGVSQPTIHRIYANKQRGAFWSTTLQLSHLLDDITRTPKRGRKMV